MALSFAVPLSPTEGVVPLVATIQLPAGVSFAATGFLMLATGLARDRRQRTAIARASRSVGARSGKPTPDANVEEPFSSLG